MWTVSSRSSACINYVLYKYLLIVVVKPAVVSAVVAVAVVCAQKLELDTKYLISKKFLKGFPAIIEF